MEKNLPPKSFFKKNPLDQMSAAVIADSFCMLSAIDRLNEELERIVDDDISEERRDKIRQDKQVIEALDSGEAVEAYMRKDHDIVVDYLFLKKALTLIEDAAPLVLKRYKTIAQDRFIELAFRLLANADERYAKQLFADYARIRDPYAKAAACLLFGEHKMQESVPLLMAEYDRFRTDYLEESYSQFPLLALYILAGKA